LSGLDLFFAATTAVSLGFNLWQLFRDRYKYSPIKDLLIGLLNDLKGRSLRGYNRQLLITSPAGMALPLEAIRLEFWDFTQEVYQGLEQAREHVVAAIQIIDPDASQQEIFNAATFGLNDMEQRFRKENMERFMENARRVAQAPNQQQGQPSSGPGEPGSNQPKDEPEPPAGS
jgi:hypothetical protein